MCERERVSSCTARKVLSSNTASTARKRPDKRPDARFPSLGRRGFLHLGSPAYRKEYYKCTRTISELPGNYGAFYENIYQHIRNGIILESDAREVVDVIRLIEAAWESSRTKSVQNL